MVGRSDRNPIHGVFEVIARKLVQRSVFFDIPHSHRVIVARAQHDVQFLTLFKAEDRLLVEFLFCYFLESIDSESPTVSFLMM